VSGLDVRAINADLDLLVPPSDLAKLASGGMRGELLFAAPCVLRANPRLLGYYRLLLGFSQKEFFNKCRLARFETMEGQGDLPPRIASEIPDLCRGFVSRASEMANAIGFERITRELLDDLTLLTLGPQLRGSRNTRIGKIANSEVFRIIRRLVLPAMQEDTTTNLVLRNASGRRVTIAFSSDPDIAITEEISPQTEKTVLAIEIKGGADKSNIWNRLGEAEKSHQSAKARGFVEFWTIYNVSDLDLEKAREKSPTTSRFYSLVKLGNIKSKEYGDFRDRLIAQVGIKGVSMRSRRREN
jgi:hypothetical protein